MDAPDELYLCGLGSERVIRDCHAKVEFFIEHDAYRAYDLVGMKYVDSPHEFQPDLLTAMNRAMMARSSRSAWQPYLGIRLPSLAAIPLDMDLIGCSEAEYAYTRQILHAFYSDMASVPWITDMAASKMLYLKRPLLTAISDSYVRSALKVVGPDQKKYPWKAPYCAERALQVTDAARRAGQRNLALLDSLQEATRDSALSRVRLLDILIWVDEAIRNGHQMWTAEADKRRWRDAAR